MTLGIVTLGGFKQRDQAVKYFRKALQIQPEVRLSPGLANPEIQAAFDEAIAALGQRRQRRAAAGEGAGARAGARRTGGKPVPITVAPDKDLGASTIVLRYRPATAPAFTDLPMQKGAAGAFEAAIPAVGDERRAGGLLHRGRRADGR